MTARTAQSNVLTLLRQPFPLEAVKQRQGGGGKMLDYVPIETVLARLLDVVPDYSWDGKLVEFSRNVNEEGKTSFVAVVEGTLGISNKFAYGVGAMVNPDPDMAVKSANSEAMKNAAKNGFGVALELWSEKYRAELNRRRKLTTTAARKNEVYRLGKERLPIDRPTAKDIASVFGVDAADLTDDETLTTILEKEGLL